MFKNGRLLPLLVVVGAVISSLTLLAGRSSDLPSGNPSIKEPTAGVSGRPIGFDAKVLPAAYQELARRNLEFWVPKHLPISVHLKPDKEKSFTDLKNDKWVHDFEIEVKNTGKKPIYYLRFSLLPDLGVIEGGVGLLVEYGRSELVYPDEPAIATDIPIQPNETKVLKILDMDLEGWDHFRELEHWPEQKSRPKKATLYFEMLNFGDGTGFSDADETPYSVPKRDKPRQLKRSGQTNYAHATGPRRDNLNSPSCIKLPADSSPANSLSKDLLTAASDSSDTSFLSPEPEPECCPPGCEYVVVQVTYDCENCIPMRHAFQVNCVQQGVCRKIDRRNVIRYCYYTTGEYKDWVGCPYDLFRDCPANPTPTPSPTATPCPSPVPCPLTSAANCPSGKPLDPCTHNACVPPELQNGCPIFYKPSLDGVCCVADCGNQPPPPTNCEGDVRWNDSNPPFCFWECLPAASPTPPDPPDDLCEFDPCCDDPICCGDFCCGDPCCWDWNCGLDCYDVCYSDCEQYCGVYDLYYEECIYWQTSCNYHCETYCW